MGGSSSFLVGLATEGGRRSGICCESKSSLGNSFLFNNFFCHFWESIARNMDRESQAASSTILVVDPSMDMDE